MPKKYDTSLFIFTRDLRLEDNTGLIEALKNSKRVIPIFVFIPEQIDKKKNSYFSNFCVQFMIQSLKELDSSLKKKGSQLHYFYSHYDKVIKAINSEKSIDAVYINEDYTPFAKKRQHLIETTCNHLEIDFILTEDHMFTGKDKVQKDNGTFYLIFTPYMRKAMTIKKEPVHKNSYSNYLKSYKFKKETKRKVDSFYEYNEDALVEGGRKNALKILKNVNKFKKYNTEREVPSLHGTTYLSAYIKFGCISIREMAKAFEKLGKSNKLNTQLYWRDFYMQIMDKHKVLKTPLRKEYHIKWENDATKIKKWKEGKTGIPIVDAAMRQMLKTGWMHNRCRMIVSNFLIKILRCDWIIGEKFFAQNLIDYDPANNNGGWQWSASTGTDSQPYYRMFNPWRQQEKYDPDCTYIKEYVPELKDVPAKDILKWDTKYVDYKHIKYSKPIVMDIQKEVKKTLKLYKNKY